MTDLLAMHYNKLVRETTLPNGSLNENPMKGVLMECALSKLFFGKLNVNVVQQEIRYKVNQITKTVIGNQSEYELFCIMHGIYLQHARHLDTQLVEQVKELNDRVYAYCVPNISSNLLQYQTYIAEVGKNPVPFARGAYESTTGTRTKEFRTF